MTKVYQHVTTGQNCNAAQYIAEMVCLREAESANEGQPAFKLWNTEKWKNKFRSQVTKAYALLKKYDDLAIINALRSPAGKRIYSLRLKNLENLIKQEQGQIDSQKSIPVKPQEYKTSGSSPPRKPYGSKSNVQKLREAEG